MEELNNYAGEFRPHLRMQDFSKDALGRIWELGGKLYIGLGTAYYRVLVERFGEQVASEVERDVWRRWGLTEYRLNAEAMNISGDDVATLFKVFQIDPASEADGILNAEYDLKNNNHGIVTMRDCQTIKYFEKHGDIKFIEQSCGRICTDWYTQCAHFVNPKIEVINLKLPPRNSKEDIACQREFRLVG